MFKVYQIANIAASCKVLIQSSVLATSFLLCGTASALTIKFHNLLLCTVLLFLLLKHEVGCNERTCLCDDWLQEFDTWNLLMGFNLFWNGCFGQLNNGFEVERAKVQVAISWFCWGLFWEVFFIGWMNLHTACSGHVCLLRKKYFSLMKTFLENRKSYITL